jgi:DNA polymerase elongation subunit (family B)
MDFNTKKYVDERHGEFGHYLMELEVIGGKGIFVKKKKYLLSLLWKDGKYIADQGKIKAIGIEIIQGTTSKFVKDSQKRVLNRLLVPGTPVRDIYRIGNQIVNRANSMPINEMCKITSIKDYDSYVLSDTDILAFNPDKTTPIHVRAAANFNKYLYDNKLLDKVDKIRPGTKIYWYYTADGNVFGVPDDVEFNILGKIPEPDTMKQVEKLIINPLKRFIFSDEVTQESFGQKEIQMTFGYALKRQQ